MKKMSVIVQSMRELQQKDQEIERLRSYIDGLISRISQLEHDLNLCDGNKDLGHN